jgi:hypothetical protein
VTKKRRDSKTAGLRTLLVKAGAVDDPDLEPEIETFVDWLGMKLEVATWDAEAGKRKERLPRLKSLLQKCIALAEHSDTEYYLSRVSPEYEGFPDPVASLNTVRDMVIRAIERPPTEKILAELLKHIDDFWAEKTGRLLAQTRNRTVGSFPHQVMAIVAPHAREKSVTTALRYYILKRNRNKKIPSHGRKAKTVSRKRVVSRK